MKVTQPVKIVLPHENVNKPRFKHCLHPNIRCHLVSFLFSIQILHEKYQKFEFLKRYGSIECKSKNSNHEEIATYSQLSSSTLNIVATLIMLHDGVYFGRESLCS